MIKHFIIFVALGYTTTAAAQFVSNYKKAGDQFYAKGDYYSAAQYYEKFVGGSNPGSGYEPYLVQKKGPVTNKGETLYRLADSYYKLNDFTHAEPWFKVLVEQYAADYPRARYWYATCLRANGQYDQAVQELEAFLVQYPVKDEYVQAADKELEVCKFIKQQLARAATGVDVGKLNGNINTEGANYAAGWLDANTLVFTSTRTNFTNALYQAPLQSGGLGEAAKLKLSTNSTHMGTPAFSPDGARMYFTAWTDNKKTALYLSDKQGTPVAIEENARQPHITPDGKYLLMASDRAGGAGGFDIWYAELGADGRPGKFVNMGANINTTADEEAPFYHAGSHTLVFASKGRTGMGGFDLFGSTGSFGGEWSAPENLGYPVNSVKDDSYYTGKGKYLLEDALISSDRSSVCCLELFAVRKKYKQVFAGQVTDCATQTPLANAHIVATDAQGNQVGEQTTSAAGGYLIEADAGATLQVSARLSGYEAGKLSVSNAMADTVYAGQLCLTKVPDPFKGQATLVTHDIYFAFAKADVTPASHAYLDQMADYLKANADVRIEIAAHTDGIGTTRSNLVLSQGRADAVLNYLVNAGVSAGQLIAKGYGECCPLEKESVKGKDRPAAREKNRRVEFKIIR